ncbi:Stf0 family sulfotransferase [Mesorhizobium sp. A556]
MVLPEKTILLCTDERTGSHLLSQHMATTGILGRPYEYFNTHWMRSHHEGYPEDVPDQFSEAVARGMTSNGVLALKMHPWAMDRVLPHVDLARDLGQVFFVLLTREDILGQAISLLKAKQTDVWVAGLPPITPGGVAQYDGRGLQDIVRDLLGRRARWELYFARNGVVPLRTTYEEVTADPQRVVHRIATHAMVEGNCELGREDWYKFDRQADGINEEWRRRFTAEFSDLQVLDTVMAG